MQGWVEFVKLWAEVGLEPADLQQAIAHRSGPTGPWSILGEGPLPEAVDLLQGLQGRRA